MADKDPVTWPAVDIRTMTAEQWLAFKERVTSEAGLERARVATVILRRLIAHCRRAPVALSPTESAPTAARDKFRWAPR
jgi:hypothetical protein